MQKISNPLKNGSKIVPTGRLKSSDESQGFFCFAQDENRWFDAQEAQGLCHFRFY
ncbi:hypothetical protein [Sphingobacterium spiritivorum]|uniref:hypothetical protein n=1 Tax=Sphingobacterium spiritivorum TaxID=258 RepID=UPI003F765CA3